MAQYNFNLAKQIINSSAKLLRAELGMQEDWFWTADDVWNKNEGFSQSFNEGIIAGISGSYWATPTLRLVFEDGSEKWFECYEGMLGDALERIENEMNWASGCLSEPVQEYINKQNIKSIDKVANEN